MTNFNDIILHFIECTHTNLLTARVNMVTSAHGGIGSGTSQLVAPSQTPAHFSHTVATYSATFPGLAAYQASFPNQTNQVFKFTFRHAMSLHTVGFMFLNFIFQQGLGFKVLSFKFQWGICSVMYHTAVPVDYRSVLWITDILFRWGICSV